MTDPKTQSEDAKTLAFLRQMTEIDDDPDFFDEVSEFEELMAEE